MKEQNEEKNLEVSGVIAKTEQFVEKNKKTITIVAGAIVVVALAIWAYVGLYARPHQQRAAEDMYAAEQWFGEGNFELALNGNDQYLGFADIIDQYGCTKSGNLAKYYAGICQLNMGKYNEAIDLLKSYKGKDTFTGAEALMPCRAGQRQRGLQLLPESCQQGQELHHRPHRTLESRHDAAETGRQGCRCQMFPANQGQLSRKLRVRRGRQIHFLR